MCVGFAFWFALCAVGSKSKFSSNYLELKKIFLIFAPSFGEMDDDIEESY